MSEQYRFMRYYLPGSLVLFYSTLLIVASLSVNDVLSILNKDGIIAVFLGFLGASPLLGYLIYAPYAEMYEHISKNIERRRSLAIVKKWAEDKGYEFRDDTQRKEFLDLVNNAGSGKDDPAIGSEVLDIMRNHLSNYSARMICGALVPVFAFIVYAIFLVLIYFRIVPSLSLGINSWLLVPSLAIIGFASLFLLWGRNRVLDEYFDLEEFLILSRKTHAENLLKSISEALNKKEEANQTKA